MKRIPRFGVALGSLGGLVFLASVITARSVGAPQGLDPDADQIVRAMSDFLEEQEQFTFRTVVTHDVVEDDLFKTQFSARQKVAVRRPDRLRAHYDGDIASRTATYDGKNFSYLDNVEEFYGTLEAPPTIDELLDKLVDDVGIQIVVSDFIYSDPYQALTGESEYGEYLGIHSVGEHQCHHIAVRTPAVDWQLWVDVGDEPLPRRMVLTNRHEPAQPQYAVTFTAWDLDPFLPDERFAFKPPEGAVRIQFGDRGGEEK